MALINRKIQSIDNIFQNYAYQCLVADDIPGNEVTSKLKIQGTDNGSKIKISYEDSIEDWNIIWLFIDFKNWIKYGLPKHIQLDYPGVLRFSVKNLKNNIEGFTFEGLNKKLTIEIEYLDFNIKSSNNKLMLDNGSPKFKNCNFISNKMDIRLYKNPTDYYVINEDGSIVTNKGMSKPILNLNDILFNNSSNNTFNINKLKLEDFGVHMFGKYPSNYLKTRYVNKIKQGKMYPDAFIEYPFNKNFEKRIDKQIRADLNLGTSGNNRKVEIISVDRWDDRDNSGIINIR